VAVCNSVALLQNGGDTSAELLRQVKELQLANTQLQQQLQQQGRALLTARTTSGAAAGSLAAVQQLQQQQHAAELEAAERGEGLASE
jgi:archaeosine-15-forming tRNA-guanine transglycosylase